MKGQIQHYLLFSLPSTKQAYIQLNQAKQCKVSEVFKAICPSFLKTNNEYSINILLPHSFSLLTRTYLSDLWRSLLLQPQSVFIF